VLSVVVINAITSGSASVDESLTIGAGVVLTQSGVTVEVTTPVGPILELRARHPHVNGSLLDIHARGDGAVIRYQKLHNTS